MKGKIISWDEDKKFGFIKGENGEKYFLHASEVKDKNALKKIVKDKQVYFDFKKTDRRLRAIEVRIAK